jgi:hypothetical protein
LVAKGGQFHASTCDSTLWQRVHSVTVLVLVWP